MHAAYRSKGEMVDAFLSRPQETRPRPAIILLHGYRGLNDAHKAVTRRFSREGFVCLSPDLFEGRVAESPEEAALLKTSLDIDRAVEKIGDSVSYLHKLPFVTPGKVVVLGFCMGGGLALYTLARSKGCAAGVIFYQSLFPDPEELRGIRVPLLCHYGTADPFTTQAEIDLFTAALDRYGVRHEIHIYDGAGHAFLNNPQGPSEANKKAAEESFATTCAWLHARTRRGARAPLPTAPSSAGPASPPAS